MWCEERGEDNHVEGDSMSDPDIIVYRSPMDGRWVVEIDTEGVPENDDGPIMRVYMNGHPIYGRCES